MTKPIGYFCSQDGLICEMEAVWGSYFQALNQSEKIWMLATVAGSIAASESENYNPMDVSNDIIPACEGFVDLDYSQQLALARFLLNVL